MYFNFDDNIKKQKRDALNTVVERGRNLLVNGNVDELSFQIWQDFSIDIMKIISKETPIILSNYYNFIFTDLRNKKAYDKLSESLIYLLNVSMVI